MNRKKYLFDANNFITSKNTFYGFDIAPTFWTKTNEIAQKEHFSIIDRIYNELVFENKDNPANEDELSKWIRTEYKGKVHSTKDNIVVNAYAKIIQKMTQETPYISYYKDSAKAHFAQITNADAWLVAYAIAYNFTVVTFEKYEPGEKKDIKIPVACKEFGVECINLYEFMRRMNMVL